MKKLPFIVLAFVFLFASTLCAQKQAETKIPSSFMSDRGKESQVIAFGVERFYYIISDSVMPTKNGKVIRVVGHVGGDSFQAYLNFSDEDAVRAPVYNEGNHDIYIFYPASFLPTIERILDAPGPVLCQIRMYENGHAFASVESPMLERKISARKPGAR